MPLLNSCYHKLCVLLNFLSPKLYDKFFKNSPFLKFFIAGLAAGSIDLILLFIFHDLLNINIVFSTSIAFLLSFLFSFYLQRVWTFENKDGAKVPKELVLYMLNAFLSLNINGFSMHFLTTEIHVWYLLAQIIVNIFLGTLNFFIYKFIIFRSDDETNCEQKQIA